MKAENVMEEIRLIDANALVRYLIDEASFLPALVARAIERAPTIAVQPVVFGEWILRNVFDEDPLECSVCGNSVNVFGYRRCPYCGANMKCFEAV